MPVLDPSALVDDRVAALRAYHASTGIERAELDVSGGIDSAVMAGLLTLALGPEQVTFVYSAIHSGGATRSRAQALIDALGGTLVVHDLTEVYDRMVADMLANLEAAGADMEAVRQRMESDARVLGSIRSCMRAPLGRGYLRLMGAGIRHGTGNECEDRWLRFYQKGGDGEVDSNPIAMLSKGEVFQLAVELGQRLGARDAYRAIVEAAPTPELWGADHPHTDEDEIADYLGLTGHGETFYGYVDPGSGAYTRVGLIERVARFVDTPAGETLFDDGLDEASLEALLEGAASAPPLADLDPALVPELLRAARRAERISRHKANPNCPTLGERGPLLAAGILTDSLPPRA